MNVIEYKEYKAEVSNWGTHKSHILLLLYRIAITITGYHGESPKHALVDL